LPKSCEEETNLIGLSEQEGVLFYLDQKLQLFLGLLASINHLSDQIRERAVN
jgi:hypothetical protein